MKILIADDDPVSLRFLERTLARLGHQVAAVSDGAAAIAALLAPDAPRLAILDWMMPLADGLEVCRTLRRRPTPYTYIILLTSRRDRADMLQGLDAEADDFLTKPCDAIELQARLRSGERVIALQEHLIEAQEALRFEATHDRLTGLWNRGMILDHLNRELSRVRRSKGSLAVLMADIDHFKAINDEHGHGVGDVVLREAGTRMRATLRAYDALGRYGGEEFLLVLPDAEAAGAREAAERVRTALRSSPLTDGAVSVSTSVSIGGATTAIGYDAAALIQASDRALYHAKGCGRDRVEVV